MFFLPISNSRNSENIHLPCSNLSNTNNKYAFCNGSSYSITQSLGVGGQSGASQSYNILTNTSQVYLLICKATATATGAWTQASLSLSDSVDSYVASRFSNIQWTRGTAKDVEGMIIGIPRASSTLTLKVSGGGSGTSGGGATGTAYIWYLPLVKIGA